jgi:hypothetical protein
MIYKREFKTVCSIIRLIMKQEKLQNGLSKKKSMFLHTLIFFMQNYTKHFYILSECGQASNQPIDINFFSFSAIDQVVTVIRTIKHQAFCRCHGLF